MPTGPAAEPEAPDPPPDPIPDPFALYWTNAYTDRPLIKPNDGANALGVLADPVAPMSIIGIAYPYTHVGGFTAATGPLDKPPPEVVWRLVLDRAWRDGQAVPLAQKQTLDGRYALRSGRFVELAEDVV